VVESHPELPETAEPEEKGVYRLAGGRIGLRLDDDLAASVKSRSEEREVLERARRQVEGLAGLLTALARPIE
jgi:hypothetical protein